MAFNFFSLPSCLVRAKDPQPKGKPERQQLPKATPPRLRPAPPKRALLPYEYPPPSGRPSMFTQLPAEIIFLIVESVDLLQRARVMLTCRYLHQVLEPFLYRHLELLDPESHSRSSRLHQTLHDRPALISQIVTYHGPLCPPEGDGPHNPFRTWDLWSHEDVRKSKALSIFKRAVNIRDLHFTDYIDWIAEDAWTPLREAVDDLVLDRLALRTRYEHVEIVQLLRNQPELTQLEILWGGDRLETLKETDIPKLKSLTAPLETAAVIAPGRPVSAIRLLPSQGADRLEEGLLQCLSLSTRPIRQFEVRICSLYKEDLVRDQLQTLARNLPTIEDLTIHVGGRISGRMISRSSSCRIFCPVILTAPLPLLKWIPAALGNPCLQFDL